MSMEFGINERIEPLAYVDPLHLHERNGFGAAAQSRKDPANAIMGAGGSRYYPGIPMEIPPLSLLPFDIPLPEEFLPPPLEFPPEAGDGLGEPPEIPPDNPPPFPFVYAGGAWWAVVEIDCEGNKVEPYWTMFAPVCGGPSAPPMSMMGVMVASND